MSTEQLRDVVDAVVRPIVAELGYDVEEVVISTPPGGREVRIVVDRDGGASLDALAEVSREAADALDDSDVLGETPYDLQVTTPGVDRPLTEPRHWRRARGRKVIVKLSAGEPSTVTGRVGDSDDERATLIRNDKGRFSTVDVMLADVAKAKIDVDFTRPGEAELRRCGLDDDEIARRRQPAQ
ncbi:MAG: ribosome maturation factor RimP [Gordonia sp. (in: high G+C Gram-positive bacteria)]